MKARKKANMPVEVIKPEKKKDLIKFWNSISLDQVLNLSDEDYECYRRFIAKKQRRLNGLEKKA